MTRARLTEADLRDEEAAKLRVLVPGTPTKRRAGTKRVGDLTVDEFQRLAARRVLLALAVMAAAYVFLSLVNPG